MLFSSFPAFKLFLIRLGQQFLLDRMRTWCLFGLRPDAQCMDHFPAVELFLVVSHLLWWISIELFLVCVGTIFCSSND